MKISFKVLSIFVFLGLFIYAPNVYAAENTKINIEATINDTYGNIKNTFTYKIESADTNPNVPDNLPTEAKIVINQTASNGIVRGSSEIDFSRVNFTKVGVYVYHLTEVKSSNNTTYKPSTKKYDIYVTVTNKDDSLKVKVLKEGVNVLKDEKEKIVFEHLPGASYVTINTKVAGRYAEIYDKDAYFKYRLKLYNPAQSEIINPIVVTKSLLFPTRKNMQDTNIKYKIVGQDKNVTFEGKNITTEDYFYPSKGEVFIYAKHNQTITVGLDGDVKQLPVGTDYSLEKIGSLKWKTTINGVERNILTSEEIERQDPKNRTYFVHTRDYDIAVTGLFLTYWPILLLICITLGGILIVKKVKVK